ncbi:MAG: hypothetical protein R6X25_03110 [Candidatus Krumholzibacteriia bacterium]
MEYPICDHLADYRTRFAAAEDASLEVAAILDRHGWTRGSAEVQAALPAALQRWREAVAALRASLVELVREGAVVMPRRPQALPRCRICRCAIHRLEWPDWDFGTDGTICFRGRVVQEPAAEPAP